MTVRFIETSAGYVNLAHVAEIQVPDEPKDDRRWRATLIGASGTSLGTCEASNIADMIAPIIPAAAGQTAVVITALNIEERPTEEDLYVEIYPILGWRLSPEYFTPDPVLPEGTVTESAVALIVMPDGSLLEPEDCRFESLEKAKVTILKRAQHKWDKEAARDAADKAAEEAKI